ncbi:uncharacterized protein LOC126660789 [Mercurialis annua]|uniref:uncharacterized protein LOC126660789 n=1 Tax=Mercurialis annua TaxID=3986 RepID=UPI00215E21E7|nr:uncharacterized protein LOC126660789 [Mercurialis annua]
MSQQTRLKPSHDPVKKLKLIHENKDCEIFSLLARFFLVLCLISSISLVLYTGLFPQTHYLHFPPPNISAPPPNSEFANQTGPTNISHILFCIGGSAATWKYRSRYSSLWWRPNETRGFVWLDETPARENAPENTSIPYRISSPEWKKFKFSSSRSAVRIARIIRESFKLREKNVRWYVMGDDDTVYYTHNLVTVLARYDHNQMMYIGGNSESVEQDVMHSYDMAFGGGGFAVSYPLAEKLVSILDGCLDRYYYLYGSDQRIWACITEIGVPLTREAGFHQFDIRGNAYGILAAHPPAPLVSLHHLDYVDSLVPNLNQIDSLKSLNNAYHVDPPRILQHVFFHDYNRKWSISIAWGYTIQLYPKLMPAKDLQTPLRTFKTWRTGSDGPFTFNTRLVKSDPCELPIVFMLETAEEVGSSGSRTIYHRIDPKPEKTCNKTEYAQTMSVQRIVIGALKLDPEWWTKERRRQCCDITNRGSKQSSMQIRIRKCRPWETITIQR